MSPSLQERPDLIVRNVFATATVVFGLLGLVLREDRFLAAAGVCGILWTLWDVVWSRILGPGGQWALRTFTEGAGGPPPNVRPTLDDTIRLLESHLDHGATEEVQVQAAIRLEEIYRTIRKDPVRARAVIARVRARFPDSEELTRFGEDPGV
jgi:hypothetical protein